MPVHGAYAMTKMALEAMTDALRREMAFHGVSVSMVNPGAVATRIVAKANDNNAALLDGMPPALQPVYANLSRAFIKVARLHGLPLLPTRRPLLTGAGVGPRRARQRLSTPCRPR